MLKGAAQFIARLLEGGGVLSALERLDNPSRLRVLAYHRVDDPSADPDLDPALISATPGEFRAQMELVASHFQPVSLRMVLAAQRGEVRLPSRAVLITFDDGYLDFARHAWPVLRELGLPAVLFVPTAFPDQESGSGFWWDRLHAGLRRTSGRVVDLPDVGMFDLAEVSGVRWALKVCKQHVKSLPHAQAMEWVGAALAGMDDVPPLARVLSWDSLRELARQGLDICPHGHRHALCNRLTIAELKQDLATSRARITSEIGSDTCASVLAWPANACNQQVCNVARELGFEMAFGGVRGVTRVPVRDVLDVMRVPVLRYQPALFRAQLRPAIAGLGRLVVDKQWKAAVS